MCQRHTVVKKIVIFFYLKIKVTMVIFFKAKALCFCKMKIMMHKVLQNSPRQFQTQEENP